MSAEKQIPITVMRHSWRQKAALRRNQGEKGTCLKAKGDVSSKNRERKGRAEREKTMLRRKQGQEETCLKTKVTFRRKQEKEETCKTQILSAKGHGVKHAMIR